MPKNEKKGFRFAYEAVQSANKGEAEILIYSDIVSWKWNEKDPEITASDFDKLLKDAVASGANKLRLRINCPGGSVWQAVAMRSMLEMSNFEEINVDIEGLCASAATFFVCIPGAHVRIAQGSEFMIHNPATSVYGGTAKDFQRTAERMTKMENEQHKMFAERTGQTEQQIKEWMDAETWFTANETVEYGFADGIIQGADAAACVSMDRLEFMQEIYNHVPKIFGTQAVTEPTNTVSNADTQVASDNASENNQNNREEQNQMEIREITAEQLQQGNPTLYNDLIQRGQNVERERIQQIEAMTADGFEAMAQEAKQKGTSAAEFLMQVVSEQQKRRKYFLNERQNETAPAQQVTGGDAADNDGKNEAEEISQNAKEMAEIAKDLHTGNAGMY